ncbi:hypothetical protein EDB84DRAFT_1251367, partial [Lactarius hengduanensis]
SQRGISKAPQYAASNSKHGVLGLIRAVDPSTRGSQVLYTALSFVPRVRCDDTAILDHPVKLLLAGIPLTPVPRIAGAVFRAATDPNLTTSGCPWVLPDDGSVIRVEKEALHAGVYDMLNKRI